MQDQRPEPAHVIYEGRLLSGRRPLLIIVGFCIALALTLEMNSNAATIAAVQAGAALALVRIFLPCNPIWTEPVRVRVQLSGLSVIRPGGRVQSATWSMFDEVRLQPMERIGAASPQQRESWRVTLMNARKAAVSSFINMDADQALFMFPLELAIDATADEAMQLERTLATMIDAGASA